MGTEPRTNPREALAGSRLALGALISGAVGIACAPIFVRLSEVGSTATAFWRLALPLLLLWTEVGVRREAGGPARRLSGRRTLLGLTLVRLFFAGDLARPWPSSPGRSFSPRPPAAG